MTEAKVTPMGAVTTCGVVCMLFEKPSPSSPLVLSPHASTVPEVVIARM